MKRRLQNIAERFEAVADVATVKIVSDSDLRALQRRLSAQAGHDPYARSAAYFAMTGRKGLYEVRGGESGVLLCRHPNLADCVLVFPPYGPGGPALRAAAVSAAGKLGGEVQLARHLAAPRNIETEAVAEDVLDWRYPVHTLDCVAVATLRGRKFQDVRTFLNGLDSSRVEAIDLDPAVHWDAVLSVVRAWAGPDAEEADVYSRQLDLFGCLPLAGRLILYDGSPAGFSIWEKTDQDAGLANAFSHIGFHAIRGMSRFVMVDMCLTLARRGFRHVCIGGSETEGLDLFKRKFCPVESINLKSYLAKPEPAGRHQRHLCARDFSAVVKINIRGAGPA
jgi:hypothetical protein